MQSHLNTLSLKVQASDADAASGVLYELDAEGIEESESGQDILLKAYFLSNAATLAAHNAMEKAFGVKGETGQIENQDWNAKWRESIEPVRVTDSIWVSPEWRPPELDTGDHWIRIEPKMAFGSGHHETTQLCSRSLEMFLKSHPLPPSVLDIGTGSGILCFIADHYGAAKCLGLEIDPDCRENLAENRELNGALSNESFVIGTCECIRVAPRFDLVVMNMISPRSQPLLPVIHKLLADTGHLIWSGLLIEEKDDCITAATHLGYKLVDSTGQGEWWCGVFAKSS